MDNIKLPGYSTLHPNQAFYKKSRIYSFDDPKEMIMDVVLLARFKQPTKDDILASLQARAKAILKKKKEDYTMFERIVSTMGVKTLEKMAQDDSPERDILRNYIPINHLVDGEEYLQIFTATVPLIELNSQEKILDEDDFDKYSRIVANEGNNNQNTQILLISGKMPPKKRLEDILDMRVRDSSAFATSYEYFDYDEAKEVVLAAYDGLKGTGKTALLVDKSHRVLEEAILKTRLAQMSEDMQRKKASIVSLLNGDRDEDDSPFELIGIDTSMGTDPKKFN